MDLEGCLSIPGISAVRRRSARVTAIGLHLDQQQVIVSGTPELARCLQHETDHLNGGLFIDGLDDDERRRVMRQIYADQITGGPSGLVWPSDLTRATALSDPLGASAAVPGQTRVGSISVLGGQLADLFEGFHGQGKVADRHDYDNRVERREAPYAGW
jgi:Polypeptide deformylase